VSLFKHIRHLARSVVRRALPKFVKRLVPKKVFKVAEAVIRLNPKTLLDVAKYGPVVGPINFTAKVVAPKIAPYVQLASDLAVAAFTPGGAKMAFNIGGFLGNLGGIVGSLGGGNNAAFKTIGNVASLAGALVSTRPSGMPPGVRTVQSVRPPMPTAGPLSRAGAVVGRGFFGKFPNLAYAIQSYRNLGKKVNRAKLYSLVRRFGPEVVISGGILTAAAVNELMIAGPGRRRMNPTNVRALRRSIRRVESFHRLCSKTDLLRSKHRKKVCR
jgi:hypothetical protein